MELKQRVYSVLLLSANDKQNAEILPCLTSSRFEPVRVISSVSEAMRLKSEHEFDLTIINSPLTGDTGLRFAVDAASGRRAVMVLLSHDAYLELSERLSAAGVFALPKPASRSLINLALNWLTAACEQMKAMQIKTLSVEEKMEEIRMVNRAKWLLISELKMDEAHAHRYIEKQAMDRCISKKEVAREIIRAYG